MRYPFIKLPSKVEATLFLIREELKSRSFFNRLEKVGFLEPNAQTHLHALIADNLGIDIHRDEDFEEFDNILDEASEDVEASMENDDLMAIVLKVYVKLMIREANLVKH
jgi:hypothetical protein